MLVFGGVGPIGKKTHNFVAFARWASSPIINGVSHEGRRNLCSQHRVWVNPPPCALPAQGSRRNLFKARNAVWFFASSSRSSLEAQIKEFLPNLGLVFRPPIVQTRACGPVMCHLGHFTCPFLSSQLSSSQIPWKVLQDAVALVEEPSVGAHLHIQQKTQQCKKPRNQEGWSCWVRIITLTKDLLRVYTPEIYRTLTNGYLEKGGSFGHIWQFLVSMLNFPGIYLNWIYRPHSGCWLSALGWHWQGVPTQNLIIQLYMVMAHTT